MSFVRCFRKAVAATMIACLLAPLATPALAWKPKTHVYLAELAMKDAVDDGQVTIYQTDYESGRILGELGRFEVDPTVLEALRAKPAQFLAGSIGPDAYPDIMTGQQIIHPGTNLPLLGDPTRGETPTVPGADAWLTHLWRLAYRAPERPDWIRTPISILNRPTDTLAIRAFVSGYLTHAAGDMFMHTFVNHYAGGDFAVSPDPRNAIKHLVLEGYVGKRTPDVHSPLSIDGVEGFIYREMTYAQPGSVLEERLLRGATSTSVPAVFSALRNGLQRDVDKYERERLSRSGPARVAYALANGPEAEYKKAWIDDIDEGLRAWPAVSHQLSLALNFDPNFDGTDWARGKQIASDYVKDHLASMVGVPDAVVATAVFIASVISAILPPPLEEALDKMERDFLKWQIEEATGLNVDDVIKYLSEPVIHFNAVMALPGGGYNGREAAVVNLSQFNREVLHIDDPMGMKKELRFEVDTFPPAFNTVQMIKMTFLSEKGMNDLLAALRAKGVDVPPAPMSGGRYLNPMLGFITSLDGDNRWQGTGAHANHTGAFFLARGNAQGWRNLFMKQIGETPGWLENTAPDRETTAPDDTAFEKIDWWSARVDDVKYDDAAGQNVVVTMTFRNDSDKDRTFSDRLAKPVRAQLSGIEPAVGQLRMEYVNTDPATMPQWHYAPTSVIPVGGRISVRFVLEAGDSAAQRRVDGITIFEQRPRSLLTLTQVIDGPSRTFALERLGSEGPAGGKTGPIAGPQVVTDIEQLRKFEGRYRTNRNTNLTLQIEGDVLVGRAMTLRQPSPRERLRLQLFTDGSLRGSMIDEVGRTIVGQYDVNLRFSPDASRFAGPGLQLFTDTPQNISYTGLREGGAEAEHDAKPGEGLPPGFVEAGFLAMRLDAVGRSTDQGVSRLDVSMTALNTQADRRGLQYNDKSFVLVTTDGSEYRWDGNTYGASSADRLVNTVWLEKEEQAQVTYVYHVPADRTPNRLSIREGGREIAGLDLAGAKDQRDAATEQKATEGGTAMGQAAALGRFEVMLDKVQRDAEGAWEALVTVRNAGSTTERLHINDLTLALYGQDGQARNMNGQFYDYAAGPRRLVESGMTLAAGAQTRFRLYFPESAGMTPVRYRVREREGQAAEGPVTR